MKKTPARAVTTTTVQQINVPRLKDVIILAQDWEVVLTEEYRNTDFIENLLDIKKLEPYTAKRDRIAQFFGHAPNDYHARPEPRILVIPAGTNLIIERIYIRQGATDYDSMTFRIPPGGCPTNQNMRGRFWVKIDNANQIIYHTV